MKKSKIMFAVVAVLVIALCAIGMIISRTGNEAPDPTVVTTEPAPTETVGPSPENTYPVDVTTPPTMPELVEMEPVKLADNVTLRQVELVGDIIRSYLIDENHPEYIDTQGGDPYACAEGIIFRNDRTLTIDITDQMTGVTHSISFGHITGQCNRFLYLNPICAEDGEIPTNTGFNYQFDYPVGGGTILNLSDNSKAYEQHTSFTIGRSLEEWNNANYTSPKTPGTVWHTGPAVDGPIYINCRVYRLHGDMIATLRLTIDRLNDGTYALVNLEDLNLINGADATGYFTPGELAYIVNFADETLHDPEQVNFYSTTLTNNHIDMEECIIQYFPEGQRLYYNQFLPREGVTDTKVYTQMLIPIVSVSYRDPYGLCTQTYYFQVYMPPLNGEHGVYNYIGRDYPQYDTIERLTGYGYTGNG